MAEVRTRPGEDASAFLAAVEPPARRQEGFALDALLRRATGWEPVLWGPSMVGWGRSRSRCASGHGGEAMATGFSPRAREISLYVLPGEGGPEAGALLGRLGPHRAGKACVHVRRLAEVDEGVLEELVRAGVEVLRRRWQVTA